MPLPAGIDDCRCCVSLRRMAERLVADSYSKELELGSYVVRPETISRLEPLLARLLGSPGESMQHRWVFESAGRTFEFDSAAAAVDSIDKANHVVTDLSYFGHSSAGRTLTILFHDSGNIRIRSRGASPQLDYDVDALERELMRVSGNAPRIVSRLVWATLPNSISNFVLVFSSFLLFVLLSAYMYSMKVGVRVDEELVPQGNDRLLVIQNAIKSNRLEEKLDALLRDRLSGSVDVSTFQLRTIWQIKLLVLAAIVALSFKLIVRFGRKLWPRSTIALGVNALEYDRLVARRSLFVGSVVVGGLVNLVTGVVLGFFQ